MELCLFFFIGIRTNSKFWKKRKSQFIYGKQQNLSRDKTRAQMKKKRNNKSANHSLISHARNDNVAKWINKMALKNDQKFVFINKK